jgi:uncharacterized FlaG/YvyC family protein
MADSIQPIKSLGSVGEEAELALTRRVAAQASGAPGTTETGRPEAVAAQKAETAPKPEAAAKKAEEPDEKPPVTSPFQNIHLKFRVDPKTNEVTVLMVDNASKRVVRTIPPDELRKMKEGDLVQLTA